MGKGGTINISNLMAATGINDNRLSAHHPNGAGNSTGIEDFLVYNMDGIASGSDPMWDILIDCHAVNGIDRNGSYNSNDYYEFANTSPTIGDGDTISVQISAGNAPGDHYLDQVATREENWILSNGANLSIDNITYEQDSSNDWIIIFEYTVTSNGGGFEMYIVYDGPLNTDLDNYGESFAFRLDSSHSEDPEYDITLGYNTVNVAGGFEVNYGASNGITPYSWEIYRQPRDPNSGDTGTWVIQQSDSESSDFSDSYDDTDVSTGTEYRYEFRCTDGGGTYQERRGPFIEPSEGTGP